MILKNDKKHEKYVKFMKCIRFTMKRFYNQLNSYDFLKKERQLDWIKALELMIVPLGLKT